jgi:hypothetical protein
VDSDVGDSSLLDDVGDTEHITGSDATLEALLQNTKGKVITRARLRHNGIIYSTSATHLGNSLVQFYPGGDTALSQSLVALNTFFLSAIGCTLASSASYLLIVLSLIHLLYTLNFLLRCIRLIFLRLSSEWELDGFTLIMLDGKCLQNTPLYYLSVGYVIYFLFQFSHAYCSQQE